MPSARGEQVIPKQPSDIVYLESGCSRLILMLLKLLLFFSDPFALSSSFFILVIRLHELVSGKHNTDICNKTSLARRVMFGEPGSDPLADEP